MFISIRRELPEDEATVENLTREAFWNQQSPGCDEHYLAHRLRQHSDFMGKLNLVALQQKEIVANIMFAKSKLVSTQGIDRNVSCATFGPLSVLPRCQRQGIGSRLVTHALEQAKHHGIEVVLIWGDPGRYSALGFRSCKDFSVASDGVYPAALLVKELVPGVLSGNTWDFIISSAYQVNEKDAEHFDKQFPKKTKSWAPSQETFKILSQAHMA